MARTTRVGSGTKVQTKEDEVDLFLTDSEMSKMSELGYESRIKQLEIDKSRQEEEKLILTLQKLQVDLELQRIKSSQRVSDLQDHKSKTQAYIINIKNKYQIQAEKFSYQPDTGKLILEELS
jgi:hypothetical protein